MTLDFVLKTESQLQYLHIRMYDHHTKIAKAFRIVGNEEEVVISCVFAPILTSKFEPVCPR